MGSYDWFDIWWCEPCCRLDHANCQPVPFCACWVELEHDEELPDGE